jgi:hypothetical protein
MLCSVISSTFLLTKSLHVLLIMYACVMCWCIDGWMLVGICISVCSNILNYGLIIDLKIVRSFFLFRFSSSSFSFLAHVSLPYFTNYLVNISYNFKLHSSVIQFNSILYYLFAESTTTRPITDTAQCRHK